MSPAKIQQLPASTKANYSTTEPVKQAMSPSLAESLRAVFAAFLWHEGIVHDAMACASFLKFHPTLPKQGAVVVTRHAYSELPAHKRKNELSKEEKARQRHSVEVSTAGTYLHIQPSVLETLTRSAANANANRNRTRKPPDNVIKEEAVSDKSALDAKYGYQTVSVLPPALKSLVHLWEELTSNCLQMISQQVVIASPTHGKGNKIDKVTANAKNDAKDKVTVLDKKSKKTRRKQIIPRKYLGK